MRREFNTVRPHEALGQTPPARHYVPSPRPYPERLEDPWYDATHQVRRVKTSGQIKWQGERIFVCEAVRGELVGSRKPSVAIGVSTSCRWNWATSIARRDDSRRRGMAVG